MFIVAGLNKDNSIFEASKNKSSNNEVVNPPAECFKQYTFPTLVSSISFYFDHSAFIEKNGQISVLGNNNEGQLGPYFQNSTYNTLTYSNFTGNTKFISSVVGSSYTLFMFTFDQHEKDIYTYISWAPSAGDENDKTHNMSIKLEVNGKPTTPAAIFGGSEKAAIIDVDGNVFVITKEPVRKRILPIVDPLHPEKNAITIPDTTIKVTRLKFANTSSFFSEKAVCVACCNNFTIVLTKSGKLYGNGKINQENNRHVTESDKAKGITDRNCLLEIEEMRGQNVVQISGTFQHSLAVTLDGRVFCVGSNFNGQLGVGPEIKNTWEFIEITEISGKYRIINASSGSGHSIMISDKGEVLTCGNNGYGQLFDDNSSATTSRRYYAEVVNNKLLKGRATFSIAGNCSSGLFINCEIPPNQPNFPIKPNKPYSIPELMVSEAYEKQKLIINDMQSKVDQLRILQNDLPLLKEHSKVTQSQLKSVVQCNHGEIQELKKKLELQRKLFESLKLKNQELSQKVHFLNQNYEIEKIFIDSLENKSESNIHFLDSKLIESFNERKLVSENGFSQNFIIEKKSFLSFRFLNAKVASDKDYNERLRRFFLEYEKLSSLDHPNIARTVGFCRGDSTTAASIVQEHEGIEMNKYSSELSEEEMKIIFEELISSLKYLLSRNIIHENLSPTTILINNNNNNSNSNNNKHIKLQILPQIELQRNEEQLNKEGKGKGKGKEKEKEEKYEEVESEVKSEVENKSESEVESEVEVEVEVEVEEWSEFKAPEVKNKNKNKNNKRNKSGIVSGIVSGSGSVEIDEKSEVYSIGILLIYLLSGLRISESKIYELRSGIEEEEEEMEDGENSNVKTDTKKKINPRMKEFIKMMISEDKNDRPTLEEVEHTIIQSGINFFE
ncbi:hypothetical protein M9Y10_028862 [Tritrichomonas musculus]|uniref:Protein kinase domain-containing protein n=1 Tax=Tritrichomonas musculus TaxID=1915356 RepID=A0ABR2KL70_9EUKA